MKNCLLCVALLVTASVTLGVDAETSAPSDFECNRDAWTTVGFYPDRQDGIYRLGDPVKFVLRTAWTNGQAGTVSATVDLKEFGGALRKGVANFTFACAADAKAEFELPSPERLGHFTVTASLTRDGRDVGYAQSAFVVAPPPVETADPWFTIDKNYYVPALGDSLRRLGFGGVFVVGGSAPLAARGDAKELVNHYASLAPGARKDGLAQTELDCIAAFNPDIFRYKPAVERVRNGFPALTEEELRRIREHARRCAELLADRVRVWVIQQEYDAFFCIQQDNVCNDHFLWMAAFANIVRNAADGIREGNPTAKIAVLGMCCNEYFWMAEKFQFAKLILPALKGHFDCVALDAYSGNWNGFNGPLTPPDDIFTDLLRAGAKLSASFGGSNEVVIAERCASTDWVGAYDGAKARDQADYTARSLILGKSVAETSRYTLHVVRDFGMIRANKADSRKRHMSDLGIWRGIDVPGVGERWVPRPAVSASGTVARKLAFSSNPRECALTDGIRLVTFDVPNGRSTAALWTSGAPLRARIVLPAGLLFCDIGGNVSEAPKGAIEQRLTTTPVFYDMSSAKRKEFEDAVKALVVYWRTPAVPNATVVIEREFGEPIVLAAPKAVYPTSALMPEYGFFKNDKRFMKEGEKSVWPKAEARFAWTPDALKAVVTVSDKDYVAGVDTAEIEILDPRFFTTGGGELQKLDVIKATPKKTTGAGQVATHVFEIPWTDVPGGNPGKDGRVAVNLMCPCAPHQRDNKVRYSLVLCEPWKPTEKISSRRFHSVFLQLSD